MGKSSKKAVKRMHVTTAVIGANVLLIAVKVAVAILTGSVAVLATLIDSIFDLLGASFAWLGVREAAKPADAKHLYGHEKIENLSSLAQSTLIAIAAFGVTAEAIRRLFAGVKIDVSTLDLALMFFTVVVDIALAVYLRRKSRELHSAAIEASAGNYYSDILQNTAALLGLTLAGLGFAWADPIAAIVLSLLMLRVAYRIGKKSANELIDASPSRAKLAAIQEAILRSPNVRGFHKLRARQLEGKIFLDVDVQLDDEISLREAHALTHEIKKRLRKLGVAEAVIHIEPLEAHEKTRLRVGR
ncbi:MAG: cation diffusion facilitator family transporter [Candidatus Norongarragalinales archaeon]